MLGPLSAWFRYSTPCLISIRLRLLNPSLNRRYELLDQRARRTMLEILKLMRMRIASIPTPLLSLEGPGVGRMTEHETRNTGSYTSKSFSGSASKRLNMMQYHLQPSSSVSIRCTTPGGWMIKSCGSTSVITSL